MDYKRALIKTYRTLLAPIRIFPGFFLVCGLLLFLPELFDYAQGGYYLAIKLAIKYFVEHLGNSLAFCYAISYLLSCILLLTKPLHIDRWVQAILLILINLYALSIIWLAKNFGITDTYSSLCLLFQTNGREASEFIQTYLLSWKFLLFFAVCCILFSAEIVLVRKDSFATNAARFVLKWGIFILLFVWALPMSIKNIYTGLNPDAIFYDNAMMEVSKNQLCHDLTVLKTARRIELKMDFKKMLSEEPDTCEFTSNNIVIVLGESYNKAHSSLYGYKLPTSDVLKQYDPIIFTDVISPVNQTCDAIRMLFSLHAGDTSKEWSETSLVFPILKKAGYNITYYSNQFVKSDNGRNTDLFTMSGALFIENEQICDKCFCQTNTQKFQYDSELINHFFEQRPQLENGSTHNITILHLNGQHIAPQDRYPRWESFYSIDSIARPELTEQERLQVAYYDNAIRYGDRQLARIVDHYKNEDAIIIFLSDHGDEANDYRSHIGRAANYSELPPAGLHCQFDVPFLLFASPLYRSTHPQIMERLEESKNKPFMTDALGHLLLYLSGVHTQSYAPEKCILDDNFDSCRKRILYSSGINYDERCSSKDVIIGY